MENTTATLAAAEVAHQDSVSRMRKKTESRIIQLTIRYLLYLATFLLPLWFVPGFFDSTEFAKQVLLFAVAAVGITLYLIDAIRVGQFRYHWSAFFWPFIGFIIAGIVSVVVSISRYASIFGLGLSHSWSLVSIIAFSLFFFLAITTIDDKGKVLRSCFLLSIFVSLIFGVLQIFGIFVLRGTPFAVRGFNTIGSINTLGVLAAISLVLLSAREDYKGWKQQLVRVLSYIGITAALFLLVVTNWWVVWTVAFASIFFFLFFSSLLIKGRARIVLFAIPMLVIVAGVVLMIFNYNLPLKSKLPVEVAPTQSTSYNIASKVIKNHPLGYGLENFILAYDQFKPALIGNTIFYATRFTDATSQVADFLIEGGFLMILAFISLILFYGKVLAEHASKKFKGGSRQIKLWAASFGLLVAFFIYPINMSLMFVLVVLLVLLVLMQNQAVSTIDLEEKGIFSFLGSLVFIVELVAFLAGGYFMVNNALANSYLAKAVDASSAPKAIDLLVKSINTNKYDDRSYRFLTEALLSDLASGIKNGPAKGESNAQYVDRIQSRISNITDVGIRSTTIQPADAQNWFERGYAYQNLISLVGGSDQAAVSMYQQSLERNPTDPVAYYRIGSVYLALAETIQNAIANPPKNQKLDFTILKKQLGMSLDKAQEYFQRSIAINNNFGLALYNLAVVYERKGQLGESIKQFEYLAQANPQDPSIVFQLGLLYYRNGQKDNAFGAWQQAVKLFPNYSNARWYLSLVYEERGDLDNALAQVRAIEKLNPNNSIVEQRLQQLESGKRIIPPSRVLDQKPL